jgi:hypothetical protein
MILCDGVHLVSDASLHELRAFAARLDLKREWEQCSKKGLLHYDLKGGKVEAAFRLGAVRADTREMARRCCRLVGGERPLPADKRYLDKLKAVAGPR